MEKSIFNVVTVAFRNRFAEDFESEYSYKVPADEFKGVEGDYVVVQNSLPDLRLGKVVDVVSESEYMDRNIGNPRPVFYIAVIDTTNYKAKVAAAKELEKLEQRLSSAVEEIDKYSKYEAVAKMIPGMDEVFKRYKELAYSKNNLLIEGDK